MHHGVYELLFTALRVTHLHGHNLNALISKFGNHFLDVSNGLRLVLLNCDGAGNVAHNLTEDSCADNNLLTLFKQSAEV